MAHQSTKIINNKTKPQKTIPEIWIYTNQDPKPQKYPLTQNQYTIGRSSQKCNIIIDKTNPVVSQVHAVITRDPHNPDLFHFQDEKSRNGTFKGRNKIQTHTFHHGDTLTLGPPELADSIQIKYHHPVSLTIRTIRYGLYSIAGLTSLALLGLLTIEWPKIKVNNIPPSNGPVVIYANDGQTPLRVPRNTVHKELQNLKDFSPYLPLALITSEDNRFYWHLGLDPIGTLRAIKVNFTGTGSRQGGSGITQQVARSLLRDYVGTGNTLNRKAKEAIAALKLETFYNKDELLKLYLNRIYLGADIYGFEDAALYYYKKPAKKLTLAQSALLVALLPSPNGYSPCVNPKTALEQRNIVIRRMQQLAYITEKEAKTARQTPIDAGFHPDTCTQIRNTKAPYYYDYIYTELQQILGEEIVREGNFIIETTIDLAIQEQAEKSLNRAINRRGSSYRFSQGGLVTIDASTGEIIAMVGGKNYKESQFNRAALASRQPGSTFKIFSYLAAIEQGISPYQTFSCNAFSWGGKTYKPCERSGGSINMYTAIAQSENSVILRIARQVGLNKVVDIAHRMGIKSQLEAVPGLVIGQSSVNILEMTSAYSILANEGIRKKPHTIRKIYDTTNCTNQKDHKTCRLLYSFDKDKESTQKVISPNLAATMTDMLQGAVSNGTGRSARIGKGEAGKTGTTDRSVDLWFIGYIPPSQGRPIVTGIWLGNDDNSATSGTSAQAAEIWADYMGRIVQ